MVVWGCRMMTRGVGEGRRALYTVECLRYQPARAAVGEEEALTYLPTLSHEKNRVKENAPGDVWMRTLNNE
jgi:hypothetical protein